MALPTSGQISINQIHVEAGGLSGSSTSINDQDNRDLIGKAASTNMAWSEWYGASAAVTVTAGGNLYNGASGFRSVFQASTGIFTDGYTINAAGQYRNRNGLVQAETSIQNSDVPQISSGNYTGGRPFMNVSLPVGTGTLVLNMIIYDESQWDFTNHDINVAHGTAASFPDAANDFFTDLVITGSGGGTVTIANNAAAWITQTGLPAADDKDCTPGARSRQITVTIPGNFGTAAVSYVFNGYT